MLREFVIGTVAVIVGLLYLLPAIAQQAAPVSTSEQMTFYQKAIGVLQAQRNKAEDDVAQATAQAQQWKEQLDRALAEVKTLKEQQAASAPPAGPVAPPKSETK